MVWWKHFTTSNRPYSMCFCYMWMNDLDLYMYISMGSRYLLTHASCSRSYVILTHFKCNQLVHTCSMQTHLKYRWFQLSPSMHSFLKFFKNFEHTLNHKEKAIQLWRLFLLAEFLHIWSKTLQRKWTQVSGIASYISNPVDAAGFPQGFVNWHVDDATCQVRYSCLLLSVCTTETSTLRQRDFALQNKYWTRIWHVR